MRAVVVLGLALWATGCGATGRAQSPQSVLQQYASAIRRGDAEEAYGWLSEDAKKRMPFEVFQRTLKERPEDLAGLADALSRPSETLEVTARVSSVQGEELELIYEDGGWKAGLGAVDLYSQATPLLALSSFVRAFEAQRFDVLLRFAPTSHQDGLTEQLLKQAWQGEQKREMLELVAALKAQLPSARAEVVADRATVAYGAAGSVQLLLEDGVWKIEEF